MSVKQWVNPTPLEIRRNDDGSLDEVVAYPAGVHLEQMSATHWWLCIDYADVCVHVNLHSKARITAVAEQG